MQHTKWMKFAKLLPVAAPALVLPVCLVLLCACDGGRDNSPQARQLQEVVNKLSAIQAQLERSGNHAHSHANLAKQQLRDVFQPLGDVVGQIVEQQQLDRQQWSALVADVRRLSQVVAVGVAQKEQAELEAMRARLDQVDARLRQQDQRSREAKAALIQALDAAGSRLDGLLKELDAVAPEPPEPKVDAGKGGGKGRGEGEANGEGEGQGRTDGSEATPKEAKGSGHLFLITFLAISVVLLVGWIVLSPNRLRPVVPQVKYTARPDFVSTQDRDGEPIDDGHQKPASASFSFAEAPELDHVEASAASAAQVETDRRGPQPVQLEVACADPETAAERIAGFLSAEPRVLLQPAPDLEAHADSLALRFYLVPSLPEDQRSRIEAAIQALADEDGAPAAASADMGDNGNDLGAA